jgi:hypothetical protein
MNSRRNTFLGFCAEITGYSAIELEGTGLTDQFQSLLEWFIGRVVADQFYQAAEAVLQERDPQGRTQKIDSLILSSAVLWPVTSNLVALWYLGTWNHLPAEWYSLANLPIPTQYNLKVPYQPSAQAYIEQLSYRTAGAHTPGAKPTGFGSWAVPPAFE